MDKLVAEIRRKLAQKNSAYCDNNSVSFRREPSKGEAEREWVPPYLTKSCLFCIHKKSYFGPCTPCRRDSKEAKGRFNKFCADNNIPV